MRIAPTRRPAAASSVTRLCQRWSPGWPTGALRPARIASVCLGDDPLILGLDIGSTRIKALLVDSRGDEVGAASVTTPFGTGAAGTETTVSALESAVAGVIAGLGPVRRRADPGDLVNSVGTFRPGPGLGGGLCGRSCRMVAVAGVPSRQTADGALRP